jgi:hypothetical protein
MQKKRRKRKNEARVNPVIRESVSLSYAKRIMENGE